MTNCKNSYRYLKLKQQLIDRLQSGSYKTGSKFISEPEISREYRLSRSTVRLAVKALVDTGYLYQIRGKGTFVRAVKPNYSHKIALIIYDTNYLIHPVTANLLRGIDQVLQRYGFALDILASKRDFLEESLFRMPEIYAGFLIVAFHVEERIIEELKKSGRPFLFVKNYLDRYSELALRIDYVQAGFLAAEILIKGGCHNLGLISPGESLEISRDFGCGVQKACLEYGASLKSSHRWEVGFSAQLANILPEILTDLPDGIICATDEQALELCDYLSRSGQQIPQDVQVVGCNNTISNSAPHPALTTVDIPTFKLGEVAASALLELINGKKLAPFPLIEPHLILRETTSYTES